MPSISTQVPNTYRAMIQTDEEKAKEELIKNSPLKSEGLRLLSKKSSAKDMGKNKNEFTLKDRNAFRPSKMILSADLVDVTQRSFEEEGDDLSQKIIKVKKIGVKNT